MNLKNRIWIRTLLVVVFILVFIFNCKKDEVVNNNDLIFNPNLAYKNLTDIDGNVYKTIQIGTQEWMAENLKTTRYNNGDLIGTTTPATLDITSETEPRYQWAYEGNENNVSRYGRLYTWYAVTDNRKVCPTDWHLPSADEWSVLLNYLVSNGYNYDHSITGNKVAKSLAALSGWYENFLPGNVGHDQSSNNRSGFSALPGGARDNRGIFDGIIYHADWWSSTESSTTNAYPWGIYSGYEGMGKGDTFKENGFSVRCIHD
jgi:uncharacterized protein (TIGR02145 family)